VGVARVEDRARDYRDGALRHLTVASGLGEEDGMPDDGGLTYFGRVIAGFMESRGLDQKGLVRRLEEKGHRGIRQQEISKWLRDPSVPGYIPGMLRDALGLDEEEDVTFQWAYTYGRVHLSNDEIVDLEKRLEAYRELRRRREKRKNSPE
jgi:hypothetical protein